MISKKIKKTVYFVRHGQSEGNATPVFQSPDSPLSKTGHQQAEQIAERVTRISFETLIASPFARAKETAEIIGKENKKIPEYSDLFTERIKPTNLAGKPHNDEEASLLSKKWYKSLHTSGVRVEDGENFEDIIKRADQALDFLQNRQEESLVVVTHGFFLKVITARVILRRLLTGESLKAFEFGLSMENTGLTVLRYEDNYEYENEGWRLWTYNDHTHLG